MNDYKRLKTSLSNLLASTVGVLLLLSCSNTGRVKEGIIAFEPSEDIDLFTLTDDISIVPLQENISVLGNIMTTKSYMGFHLLFDDSRYALYVYDKYGEQVLVLNKLGRAENEYMDIGTYSYCTESQEVLIFERATKSIKKYSIKDGSFCGSVKLDHYLNAMESIGEDLIVGIREVGRDGGAAIELIDTKDSSIKQKIDLRADQAELMMDICFSPSSNGKSIYITVPGHPNIVYSASEDGITVTEEFLFSPDALGEKYWAGDYDDAKEDMLMEALEEGSILPLAPVLYTKSGKRSSFWVVTSEERYYHNLPSMRLITTARKGQSFCTTINGKRITPTGAYTDGYVTVIETSELNEGHSSKTSCDYSMLLFSTH